MHPGGKITKELERENAQLRARLAEETAAAEALRARLAEAEEALDAIRHGEVDALLVSHPDGDQIYTLQSADSAYRVLVENMREGAVNLLSDGTILYCNQRFAEMVGRSLENVLGTPFEQFLSPADRSIFQALRRECQSGKSGGEVQLLSGNGVQLSVQLSLNELQLQTVRSTCMVVTDLSAQKRNERIAADERLARAILEQAAECIVVCDEQGMIIRASQEAARYTAGNPLRQPFERLFPLGISGDNNREDVKGFSCAPALGGERIENQEVLLRQGETVHTLLVNAGPLHDAGGQILGCVISLTDITERKQTEQALHRANEQLRETDRRKDEFLAMLAHELRNPLAPVRNAVHVLRLAGSREDIRQRQQDTIDRQVTHMARLLDDLLDVSRVTRGKIDLRRQPLDLTDVLAHAIETTTPLIEARRHTLHVSMPPASLRIEGDIDRLAQVVGNLLVNSAKYTDAGGQICLAADLEDGQAVVRVRDNGVGIASELLPRVFDLFAQADNSLGRAQGGLGIGLTMVQSLVQMHRGTVEARSAGLGQGSEFIVRLPALTEKCSPGPEGRAAQADSVPRPLSACRVLIVDDVVDSAESLTELVALWGHEARAAHSGAAALEMAHDFRPDVALLDIGMPGMDGYEVARRLRAEHGQKLVLVAMTGYGQTQDREATREAGFNHHLVKPVDLEAMRVLLLRGQA